MLMGANEEILKKLRTKEYLGFGAIKPLYNDYQEIFDELGDNRNLKQELRTLSKRFPQMSYVGLREELIAYNRLKGILELKKKERLKEFRQKINKNINLDSKLELIRNIAFRGVHSFDGSLGISLARTISKGPNEQLLAYFSLVSENAFSANLGPLIKYPFKEEQLLIQEMLEEEVQRTHIWGPCLETGKDFCMGVRYYNNNIALTQEFVGMLRSSYEVLK